MRDGDFTNNGGVACCVGVRRDELLMSMSTAAGTGRSMDRCN